ncbi:MAG: hypothetical protein K2X82_16700 [Gemmataceae bacterium]|nr:hypothetical protein [Gemmataceae bacterium]
MSYRLRYTGKAAGRLALLPADLVEAVDRGLEALADRPVTLSVPIASPPFPPRGQLYHFEAVDSAGGRWFFTVIFRYSQDETALHILSVTWTDWPDA